jgi:hypothetical protein
MSRPKRTSIAGNRLKLNVRGKEPGFHYCIVNDTDDRIQQFTDRGYEIVTDNNVVVGDKRIANPTKEGSPKQMSVGGGIKAYVMRIKNEWYDEDQAAKNSEVNKTEEALLREVEKAGFNGKLNLSRD